jgi:hypothetical protein
MNQKITSWKYDKNKDYSIYYGKECIVTINYGLMNKWRTECIKNHGILHYISKPKPSLDDGQSVTITLNDEPPKFTIYSKLITSIELNYTIQSMSNLNKLRDFIDLKLGNDVFEEIKKFLLPDLISI